MRCSIGDNFMQWTRQVPWRAIISLVLLACAATPAAAEPTFSTVALSGQPAPGISGTYGSVYSLSVNDTGQLAFGATLESPDGTGAGEAIIAGLPDALNAIARSGSPASGLPSGLNYSQFRDLAINNTGRVAFRASITNSSVGIFSGPLNAPKLVAWSGGPVPGAPLELVPSLDRPLMELNEAGDLAFGGKPGDLDFQTPIIAGPPNALGIVARSGAQAPGLPVGVHYAGVRDLGFNDAGQVVFRAGLEGQGRHPALDEAIFAGKPGSVALVARTGSPAPGMPPGVSIDYIGGALLNNSGQVALSVRLGGAGSTEGNDAVIYVGPIASPSLAVRTGDPAPGTRSGVSYKDFWVSALNDAGQFAFSAHLQGPGVTEGWNYTALYVGSPGAMTLVARDGSQAPGTQPGVTFDTWNGGSGPSAIELNDRGQLAFQAKLQGTWEVEDGWGLFLYDPLLGTTPVARTGELFDVGGGDLRRIEDISYNYGGGVLSDDGRLAFSLTFTDGSSGVFVATVPEPGLGLVSLGAVSVILLGRRGAAAGSSPGRSHGSGGS